jgi:ATP-binding cassette subfamily B protein
MATPPEIKNRKNAFMLDRLQGRIVFDEVHFSYNHNGSSSVPVLSGISLVVEPGTVLGVVGPPGSGKTTMLSLIPRLYDVSRGKIRVDGQDIRALRMDNLRSHIAFMPQEPFLFAGTIRENITFGNPLVNETILEKIIRQAALTDTIRDFPKGLETIVGEKGVILSGGQKQRIALARCLIQPAGILVLDDPISQVDLETGNAIVETIKSMAGRKTVIIVSHRISAVSFAEQIVALDGGQIIELGTHRNLIQSDHYYARAFRLQEFEEGVNAS